MPKLKPQLLACLICALALLAGCTTGTKTNETPKNETEQTEEATAATSDSTSETTDTEEQNNETVSSIDWTHMSLGEIESASEITTVAHFWEYLADGEIDKALAMMDASEATKQAWATNFATIEKLQTTSIGPVRMAEWTDTRQIFKIHLDVQISAEGEQIGWTNGENERWITLQKNGSVWQVHELANNR